MARSGRRNSLVTVTYSSGETDVRPARDFLKPKVNTVDFHVRTFTVCGRCSTPVREVRRHYRLHGTRRYKTVLVDTYGIKGLEHACPPVVRASAANTAGRS